jgi:hypothetical protein
MIAFCVEFLVFCLVYIYYFVVENFVCAGYELWPVIFHAVTNVIDSTNMHWR